MKPGWRIGTRWITLASNHDSGRVVAKLFTAVGLRYRRVRIPFGLAYGLATLLEASAGPADVPRALVAYEELRRERTARVQQGSRRQGAGWDSSGSQLVDRRWIYEYDVLAEAMALTR